LPQKSHIHRLAVLALGAMLLTGCSSGSLLSGGDSDDGVLSSFFGGGKGVAPDLGTDPDGAPIAQMYNSGVKDIENGEYRSAVKKFTEVERQHPYSKWATKAILMQAYAQYQRNSYPESIAQPNASSSFTPVTVMQPMRST
jgi:outer membrane protein assembly factor BamD